MRLRQTIGLSLVLLAASATAMAKQADTSHDLATPSIKSKPAKAKATVAKPSDKRRHAHAKLAAGSSERHRRHASGDAAPLPPPDQYIGPVQTIGQPEVGEAAWYGGRHLGMRTASGERLDAVHATAAHRSLPLLSLVRVTNLHNGRSIIARINDRGPVSRSLLIDVSPRVAETLDMKRSGIVRVTVVPVAPAVSAPPH